MKALQSCTAGDTTIEYTLDEDSGRVGLAMCPTRLLEKRAAHRERLGGAPEIQNLPSRWAAPRAWNVHSLVQLALVGDWAGGGHAQGRTMLNSPATIELRYQDQQVLDAPGGRRIITRLHSPRGFSCVHELSHDAGQQAVSTRVTFRNDSPADLTLAMLGSFSLGQITPFAADDAPGRLRVHRFRSVWSAEGRLDTQTLEQLHLERSWIGHGAYCERFGQVGSMPVRGFFPLVAIEDTEQRVLWGAQLAWAGSWQMEVYRRDDFVLLAGGLADREFGHWCKRIAPGESFTSPPAYLACVEGTLEDLTDRLTRLQVPAAENAPRVEHDLPIIFNEWCTSWGEPSHDKLIAIADRLRGTATRYLVIDAGWYRAPHAPPGNSHGDWIPSPELFPDGLAATAAAIRQRGLIPGLWFEMENAGVQSSAFQMTEHLLRRDGQPFTVEERRFWDLNDPFVIDYLSQRIIDLLERCDIGYLKVDYNETLGIGVDHPDSLGEGLRRQIEGTYSLFRRIRQRLPELVIENCASGGHRLEPSMMALSSMGSFSDAHETREIPIIAANLHQLILPRQSQVWAVLRKTDDLRRLTYSLAATFLGRMCLSGDVEELSEQQWQRVLEAQDLYRRVGRIIKHGRSRRFGPPLASWRHPAGWQAVLRMADGGDEALLVVHTFAEPCPQRIEIPLPAGAWAIAAALTTLPAAPRIEPGKIRIDIDGQTFSGAVLHLRSSRQP